MNVRDNEFSSKEALSQRHEGIHEPHPRCSSSMTGLTEGEVIDGRTASSTSPARPVFIAARVLPHGRRSPMPPSGISSRSIWDAVPPRRVVSAEGTAKRTSRPAPVRAAADAMRARGTDAALQQRLDALAAALGRARGEALREGSAAAQLREAKAALEAELSARRAAAVEHTRTRAALEETRRLLAVAQSELDAFRRLVAVARSPSELRAALEERDALLRRLREESARHVAAHTDAARALAEERRRAEACLRSAVQRERRLAADTESQLRRQCEVWRERCEQMAEVAEAERRRHAEEMHATVEQHHAQRGELQELLDGLRPPESSTAPSRQPSGRKSSAPSSRQSTSRTGLSSSSTTIITAKTSSSVPMEGVSASSSSSGRDTRSNQGLGVSGRALNEADSGVGSNKSSSRQMQQNLDSGDNIEEHARRSESESIFVGDETIGEDDMSMVLTKGSMIQSLGLGSDRSNRVINAVSHTSATTTGVPSPSLALPPPPPPPPHPLLIPSLGGAEVTKTEAVMYTINEDDGTIGGGTPQLPIHVRVPPPPSALVPSADVEALPERSGSPKICPSDSEEDDDNGDINGRIPGETVHKSEDVIHEEKTVAPVDSSAPTPNEWKRIVEPDSNAVESSVGVPQPPHAIIPAPPVGRLSSVSDSTLSSKSSRASANVRPDTLAASPEATEQARSDYPLPPTTDSAARYMSTGSGASMGVPPPPVAVVPMPPSSVTAPSPSPQETPSEDAALSGDVKAKVDCPVVESSLPASPSLSAPLADAEPKTLTSPTRVSPPQDPLRFLLSTDSSTPDVVVVKDNDSDSMKPIRITVPPPPPPPLRATRPETSESSLKNVAISTSSISLSSDWEEEEEADLGEEVMDGDGSSVDSAIHAIHSALLPQGRYEEEECAGTSTTNEDNESFTVHHVTTLDSGATTQKELSRPSPKRTL